MRRDAHVRTDPVGIPLFSASHVDQWDALPSSPTSSSLSSVNDHEWPLLRSGSTPSDHASFSTATRPKTLLLSSNWLGRTQPRADSRQARSGSVASVEVGGYANLAEDRKSRSEQRQCESELPGRSPSNDGYYHYCRADNVGVVACHCQLNVRANGNAGTSILPAGGKTHRMAVKTHAWVSLWFLLTAPVIVWDAFYCFMRPRSMIGGDLHWIWEPYGLYQNIDYVYGVEALQRNDGFPNAQSFMNIIETLLNLTYVYLTHVSGTTVAPLIGFAAATMTLSKTVLYWAQEFYCGWCATGHNDFKTLLVYWLLPNGLWIVFPSLIVYTLGKDIATTLGASRQRAATKAAMGKKN